MLLVLGKALAAGAWLIQGVTLDGHHAHHYVKEALFGVFYKLDPQWLQDLPFWREVTYRDMPRHGLPRLPVRICIYEGESLWCLAGPCNLDACFFNAHGFPKHSKAFYTF